MASSVQTESPVEHRFTPPWMRAVPGEETHRHDTLHRLGLWSALVLIFLRFSFLHETITYFTGVNTYVLYIFGPIALFSSLLSGGWPRTFREPTGKYWVGFLIWMAVAVPFSSWFGGSAIHFVTYLRTDFPMLLVTAGIVRSWAECRKIFATIALAALVNVVTAHLMLHTEGGRLSLSSEGTISNSNDLAAHLLLVLPFLAFYFFRPRKNLLFRLILLGGLADGLFQVLRTGSRGALVALVLTSGYVLFRGSRRQKLAIAVAAPVALGVLISVLPAETWQRLTSFSDKETASDEAMESSEARRYLLKQSLVFTATHPLFGVGPGQFSSFEGSTMTSQGKQGNWHETHNSYTQVSAECGIPALVFYLLALLSTFAILRTLRKRALLANDEEISSAAFTLSVALVAYSTATFFISFAYHFHLLAISGLVIAMRLALQNRFPATTPARKLPWETPAREKNTRQSAAFPAPTYLAHAIE